MLSLASIACSVCGAESVEESDDGTDYRCGGCSYDTRATYPPEVSAGVQQLQDIGIAQGCLETARAEFAGSRHTVTRERGERRERGPYPERYLEGLEQVQEAITLLIPPSDTATVLGTALEELGSIPPPADRHRFNVHVSEAIENLDRAKLAVAQARQSLVASLRERLRA